MSSLRALMARVWGLAHAQRVDRDLQAEIASHLEEATQDYLRQGLSPAEAHYAALRSFGGVAQTQELHRDARIFAWPDQIARDLRHALRALRRAPGFAAVAVLTLALGIGANTAIFSVVDAVLLRPLPYRNAARIARIRGSSVGTSQPGNLSPMDFLDLQQQTRRFEQLAAFNNYADATLTGAGDPERVVGTRVTADFFRVLGVRPQMGRGLRPEDDVPGASPVAILASGFWQRQFGGDPSFVGRTIRLNGVPTEVVGVLPGAFRHPFPENARQPDVYVPFRLDRKENARSGHYLQAIGRLSAGASFSDARADLSTIAAALARSYPASNTGRGVTIVPLFDSMTDAARTPMLILQGMVAFVLLIACANLANLLLARSTTRQKEIAVRQALGASRAQLVRQFLVESVVLAVAGGAAGLLVAGAATRVLVALGANRIPRAESISLDPQVLLFTLVLSLVTGIVFGVGPALYASRLRGPVALKEGGRAGEAPMHQRMQHALIVSEMALALMLFVSAGLLVKSLWRLQQVDPGFRTDEVLTFQTSLPLARYPEGDEIPFYQQLEDRLRPLPGVLQVGAVNILPLSGNYSCDGFDIVGRPPSPAGQQPCAEVRSITPGYFDAIGIPLHRGRAFTRQDVERSRPVMIISDTMAQRFWPDADPVGSQIVYEGKPRVVVGIVAAVKHLALDRDTPPEMYTPHAQQPSFHTMTLVVRSAVNPTDLTGTIRREVLAIDRDVPMANIRAMRAVVDETTTEPRFRTLLVAAFAMLAVLLAVGGVAGVIAYSVGRRTHEIGVRVALGATRANVVSLLLQQGMLSTAIGLGVGIAGALAMTRVLANLLFGVSTTDVSVFAGASVLLAIAALGATYLPARRATRVDPMIALRAE
jgi:putative ABC transport system permease protein